MGPSIPILGFYQNCASNTLESATYTEVEDSLTENVNMVEIYNPGSVPIIVAIGAAASEDDLPFYAPPGASKYPILLSEGQRIAVKAVGADITSGYLIMNFYR